METVSKARVTAVATLIAAGSIVAAYGTDGVIRLWEIMLRYGPYALVAAGVLALAGRLVPRVIDPGPILLILIGASVIAVQRSWFPGGSLTNVAGLLTITVGGWLMTATPSASRQADPVRRASTAILPRRVRIAGPSPTPLQISVLAVCGRITLDLRDAADPELTRVEITVSCWAGGSVDIFLPGHWAIACGRVESVRAIRMAGRVDTAEITRFPDLAETRAVLRTVAEDRLRTVPAAGRAPVAVVVHIVGVLGRVTLAGR